MKTSIEDCTNVTLTKVCSSCHLPKTLVEFYRHPKKKYGVNNQCKLCHSSQMKVYRSKNKLKVSNIRRAWKNTHKDQINAYETNRRTLNLDYKIRCNLRSRLSSAISRLRKNGSAVKNLGCSLSKLIFRLEQMFYPHPITGELMTWDNYGKSGWHIDHIKPLCSFDLTVKSELLVACHYTNLQPLWAIDNYAKISKDINFKLGNEASLMHENVYRRLY